MRGLPETMTAEPRTVELSAAPWKNPYYPKTIWNFIIPVRGKPLVALRQQLGQESPESLAESQAAPEPADSTSEPKLCYPYCGQPLLLQHAIQPTGRCPA